MLNQKTVPSGLVGEPVCGTVSDACAPSDVLLRWACQLRDRGLGDAALILTELLKVWGFVGSQVLWMLAPFVTNPTLTSVATVLESPEMLDRVRICLEGDPARHPSTHEGKGACR